nr:MAG TPA_asm: hypothetical protein [Bacteriophage sp.]
MRYKCCNVLFCTVVWCNVMFYVLVRLMPRLKRKF